MAGASPWARDDADAIGPDIEVEPETDDTEH